MTAPADDDHPVPGSAAPIPAAPSTVLSIPEVRDYQRINAELAQRLDEGYACVRLAGAEGQRLLLSGMAGSWSALVEIEGDAGPELAAGLDAPGLTIIARGRTADGAGARLRAGRLILLGDTGDALGVGQQGGVIVAVAAAGHRAGLGQSGGVLVVLGPLGRLAGERQAGGRLFFHAGRIGPHAGHGHRGGALLRIESATDFGLPAEDAAILRTILHEVEPWIADPPRGV
jgi:glutamate synthase domain-containing protein 3